MWPTICTAASQHSITDWPTISWSCLGAGPYCWSAYWFLADWPECKFQTGQKGTGGRIKSKGSGWPCPFSALLVPLLIRKLLLLLLLLINYWTSLFPGVSVTSGKHWQIFNLSDVCAMETERVFIVVVATWDLFNIVIIGKLTWFGDKQCFCCGFHDQFYNLNSVHCITLAQLSCLLLSLLPV